VYAEHVQPRVDALTSERDRLPAPAASVRRDGGRSADGERRQAKADVSVPEAFDGSNNERKNYKAGFAGKMRNTTFGSPDGSSAQAYLAGMRAGKHNADVNERMLKAAGIPVEVWNALTSAKA
jgi:hypothetical protein